MQPINVNDYEVQARSQMKPAHWDFYNGGSDDEVTLRENRAAFDRIKLRPRMLVHVDECDLRTTVIGIPVQMPILIAPTAMHGLAHPEGECATAQGAGLAGTLMVASTTSSLSMEEVAAAATGPLWFQLYLYRGRTISEDIVHRAEAVGYRAIVLTVDLPRLGNRERDTRNGFSLGTLGNRGGNVARYATSVEAENDKLLWSWELLPWLRSVTKLPILLKGILTAEDARIAVEEYGVEGILVSNHGGRQLDGAIASIEALPEVVEAVNGRCEVYVDGGVRRGTDILKALALGARAVLVGRPVLWGLAVNGPEGVRHVLDILHTELDLAMVLAGCPTLASINRSLVRL